MVLAVIMVISLMPAFSISAGAANEGDTFTVDNTVYKVLSLDGTNNTVGVCGVTSTDITAVDIPRNVIYDDTTYTVVSILSGAYVDCRSLTSVIRPNSVPTIW